MFSPSPQPSPSRGEGAQKPTTSSPRSVPDATVGLGFAVCAVLPPPPRRGERSKAGQKKALSVEARESFCDDRFPSWVGVSFPPPPLRGRAGERGRYLPRAFARHARDRKSESRIRRGRAFARHCRTLAWAAHPPRRPCVARARHADVRHSDRGHGVKALAPAPVPTPWPGDPRGWGSPSIPHRNPRRAAPGVLVFAVRQRRMASPARIRSRYSRCGPW
jgi:hypothetical protein